MLVRPVEFGDGANVVLADGKVLRLRPAAKREGHGLDPGAPRRSAGSG